MLITSMVSYKSKRTWKPEDQLSALLRIASFNRSTSSRTRDTSRRPNSMLKSNTIEDTCKWELKPKRMLNLIIGRFGRDKLLSVSKSNVNGNSKTCMLQSEVHWTSSKWRMAAAELVAETSSTLTSIQRVPLTSTHSQLRMLPEPRTSNNTVMWTRTTQEMLFLIKSSTTIWRDTSTKSKSFVSETKWIEMRKIHWWVRTCSTALRERRPWNSWDLTGRTTSKIRIFSKELVASSNEHHRPPVKVYV